MSKKKPQEISEEIGDTSMQEAAEITSGIPMYQKAPAGLSIPQEFNIGNQKINKEALIAQRDKDVLHTITGVTDTAGYKRAVELRGQYRTTRTTLEKLRKELSAPHQDYVKKLKEVTDDLGKEAYIGEEFFNDMIVATDNEKTRIKEEEEKKRLAIMHNRIQQLLDLNSTFDGSVYTFGYAEELMITMVEVKELNDENFGDFINQVSEAYSAEQARIDAERIEAEEQALIAEQQAEEIRKQAEANEEQEKALVAKRIALRVKELKLMGFSEALTNNNDTYYRKEPDHISVFAVTSDAIEDYDDEVWDEMIHSYENHVPEVQEFTEPIVEQTAEVEPDILGVRTELNETVAFSAVDEASFDAPDTSEINTVVELSIFDDPTTYFDIIVTPKRTVRLFTGDVKHIDIGGLPIDKVGNHHGLKWAIIKT